MNSLPKFFLVSVLISSPLSYSLVFCNLSKINFAETDLDVERVNNLSLSDVVKVDWTSNIQQCTKFCITQNFENHLNNHFQKFDRISGKCTCFQINSGSQSSKNGGVYLLSSTSSPIAMKAMEAETSEISGKDSEMRLVDFSWAGTQNHFAYSYHR